jgi:gamma-glutamyl:cysteine ligase YbdK (ATP-grasp superfamily)
MSVSQTCALQPHIQCSPDEFVSLYNAFLMSAGFALAPATSSPIVLGKVGQMESRIEAFEQAWLLGRVFLGKEYITTISQPFVENVSSFRPVFVDIQDRDEAGVQLNNLRMQNGSIHRWVRPVYDSSPKPHVRIELRTLPMCAAPHDNVANIAWAVGLAYGFAKLAGDNPNQTLSIEKAAENFKSAAQYGLRAKVWVPDADIKVPYFEYQHRLCSIVGEGLKQAGVNEDIAQRYVSTIAARFNVAKDGGEPQPQTESDWIIKSLSSLTSATNRSALSHEEALAIITYELHKAALKNIPVHEREILSL